MLTSPKPIPSCRSTKRTPREVVFSVAYLEVMVGPCWMSAWRCGPACHMVVDKVTLGRKQVVAIRKSRLKSFTFLLWCATCSSPVRHGLTLAAPNFAARSRPAVSGFSDVRGEVRHRTQPRLCSPKCTLHALRGHLPTFHRTVRQ